MNTATDLLLSLSRLPVTPGRRRRASDAIATGVDWNLVFILARRWYVEPVALSNLRKDFAELLPIDVLERVVADEQEARVLVLSRTLMVVDLSNRLNEAGVRVVVLKGPTISIAAYGDASLRTFADADLLIRSEDVSAARDLLLQLGFTRDYDPAAEQRLLADEHALEFASETLKVELHCSLMSRHLRFRLGADEIRERAIEVRCGGSAIRSLAIPDLFLFMCAHGAKHEWERVSWVCDVAQLAERLSEDDCRTVATLARRTSTVRLVTLALHVAREVYGGIDTPLDRFVESSSGSTKPLVADVLNRLGLNERAPSAGLLTRLDPRLRPLVFWSRARERPVDRIASLARVIFVPTDNDVGPTHARWVTRPLRLALRALRNTARANVTAA